MALIRVGSGMHAHALGERCAVIEGSIAGDVLRIGPEVSEGQEEGRRGTFGVGAWVCAWGGRGWGVQCSHKNQQPAIEGLKGRCNMKTKGAAVMCS